jgi:hypothetical protein
MSIAKVLETSNQRLLNAALLRRSAPPLELSEQNQCKIFFQSILPELEQEWLSALNLRQLQGYISSGEVTGITAEEIEELLTLHLANGKNQKGMVVLDKNLVQRLKDIGRNLLGL